MGRVIFHTKTFRTKVTTDETGSVPNKNLSSLSCSSRDDSESHSEQTSSESKGKGPSSEAYTLPTHTGLFEELAGITENTFNIFPGGLGMLFAAYLECQGIAYTISDAVVETGFNLSVLATPEDHENWHIFTPTVKSYGQAPRSFRRVGSCYVCYAGVTYRLAGAIFRTLGSTRGGPGGCKLLRRHVLQIRSGFVVVPKGAPGAQPVIVNDYEYTTTIDNCGETCIAYVPRELLYYTRSVGGDNSLARLDAVIQKHHDWLFWAASVQGRNPKVYWLSLHSYMVQRNKLVSIRADYVRAKEVAVGKEIIEDREPLGLLGAAQTNTSLLPLAIGALKGAWTFIKKAGRQVFAGPNTADACPEGVVDKGKDEEELKEPPKVPVLNNAFVAASGAVKNLIFRHGLRDLAVQETSWLRWLRRYLARPVEGNIVRQYRMFNPLDMSKGEKTFLAVSFAMEELAAWWFPPSTLAIALFESVCELFGPFSWAQWWYRQAARWLVAGARLFAGVMFGPFAGPLIHFLQSLCGLSMDVVWNEYQCSVYRVQRDRGVAGKVELELRALAPVSKVEQLFSPFDPAAAPFAETLAMESGSLVQERRYAFERSPERVQFAAPIHFAPQNVPDTSEWFRGTVPGVEAAKYANDIRYKRTPAQIKQLNRKQEEWLTDNPFASALREGLGSVGYRIISRREAFEALSQNTRQRLGNKKFGVIIEYDDTMYFMIKPDESIATRAELFGDLKGWTAYTYSKTRGISYGPATEMLFHMRPAVGMADAWKRQMKEQGYVFRQICEPQCAGGTRLVFYYCYGFVKNFAEVTYNLRQTPERENDVVVVIWAGGDDSLVGVSWYDTIGERRYFWKEFDFSKFDSTQSITMLRWLWQMECFAPEAVERLEAIYGIKKLRVRAEQGFEYIPYYGTAFSGTAHTSNRNTMVCWLAVGWSFYMALNRKGGGAGTLRRLRISSTQKAWVGAAKILRFKENLTNSIIKFAARAGFVLKDESIGHPTFLASLIYCPEEQTRGVAARLTLGRFARAGQSTFICVEEDMLRNRHRCGVTLGTIIEELEWNFSSSAARIPLSVDAGPLVVRFLGLRPMLLGCGLTLSAIEANYLEACAELCEFILQRGGTVPKFRVPWTEFLVKPHGDFPPEDYAQAIKVRYTSGYEIVPPGVELGPLHLGEAAYFWMDDDSPTAYRQVVRVDYGAEAPSQLN